MLGNTTSAEVKSRYGSIDKLMRDLSTDNNKWREMLEDEFDVNQFDGWMFMRIAEINQTAVLWNAKYNEVLADTGDKSQAAAKADWVIENTQQSGQLMNLSEWQRGGVLIRSIMPFKNDVINEFNSLVRILVANGTKTEKAKRLVSYAVYDMAWPAMVLSSAQALDKGLKIGVVTMAASAGLIAPPDDKNSREKRTTVEQMRDDFVRFGLLQPISAFPFVDKLAETAIVEAEAKALPYGKEGARPPKVTQQPNIFDQPIYAVSTGKFAYAAGTALGIPLTPYWAPLFDMKEKKKNPSSVPEY